MEQRIQTELEPRRGAYKESFGLPMDVSPYRKRNNSLASYSQAHQHQSGDSHCQERRCEIAHLAMCIDVLPMMDVTRCCSSSDHKTEQDDEDDLMRPPYTGLVISIHHLAVIIPCHSDDVKRGMSPTAAALS